jgi:hypothetical protein
MYRQTLLEMPRGVTMMGKGRLGANLAERTFSALGK